MLPSILACVNIMKDLFIPQRSNIVWFYLDEYGSPIKQSLDFEVFEESDITQKVSEIIYSPEFEIWLKKTPSHNKIESEYCMTYHVTWDNKVLFRYFSKR